MSKSNSSPFGGLRTIFWPIHHYEAAKIIPMFLILFLIAFNYSVLRSLKDTVIITAKSSGAEVIPFIKVWAMLPMAILLTYVFTKLAHRYSQERVFYTIIGGFLLFFALFAYVIYPLRDTLHPGDWADHATMLAPEGLKGLIAMVRYWSFTIFYVMSELWGSIALSVLFWGFANDTTTVEQSRRFYGFLGVGANAAAILAGVFANVLTQGQDWDNSLLTLINLILCNGLLTMGIFWWLNHSVLNREKAQATGQAFMKQIEKKRRISIRESFRYLANSPYLIYIAILVISYNLVLNLVEVIWKAQLRELHPSPHEYNNYMNTLTTWVGIISTVTAFFLSRLLKRFGWTTIALITPLLMLITSAGFFGFFFFRHQLEPLSLALLGCSSLAVTVFFGGAQVCISKAAKYSVFDTTKEMAFIPLDHESKLRGKAAIDGVASRFGKSGGSMIHQGLFLLFGPISMTAPYIAMILFLVIGFWMMATKALGREYNQTVLQQEQEEEEREEAAAISPVLTPQEAG